MKAYIFDFDGTLADSAACAIHATQMAFQQLSLPVPSEEQISYYMGIPIEHSFKEMGAHHLSSDTFEQLLHTFRQMYAAIEDTYLRLFPYVKEGLERLQAQGILLFVVSSKKTNVLHRNLHTLGIRSYFKDLIGSDQVTQFKPHPEGIQQLLNRYELKVNKCLMIGDAIFDIQMGKAAGCKTCAVTWGSHTKVRLLEEQPTFCVDKFEQILSLED